MQLLSRTSLLKIVTSPYFYFRFVGNVKVFPRPGALSERNFRQANKGYLPWTKQNHAV